MKKENDIFSLKEKYTRQSYREDPGAQAAVLGQQCEEGLGVGGPGGPLCVASGKESHTERNKGPDYAVKVLHSIFQQIWKTQQWPQDWKRSVFIPIPKKDNAKECSNYSTIALILHASKVKLKILQARLQQYVNCELPDVQVGFRKGRGTTDQIANIRWIIEKGRVPKKHLLLLY